MTEECDRNNRAGRYLIEGTLKRVPAPVTNRAQAVRDVWAKYWNTNFVAIEDVPPREVWRTLLEEARKRVIFAEKKLLIAEGARPSDIVTLDSEVDAKLLRLYRAESVLEYMVLHVSQYQAAEVS